MATHTVEFLKKVDGLGKRLRVGRYALLSDGETRAVNESMAKNQEIIASTPDGKYVMFKTENGYYIRIKGENIEQNRIVRIPSEEF